MFQAFTNKVVTGIISLSMLIFSSYQGNRAQFSELILNNSISGATIETKLLKAFDNDFEEIFKSGSAINVFFNLEINSDNDNLQKSTFRHEVLYNQQTNKYDLYLEEQDLSLENLSYLNMLENLSYFSYDYTGELPSNFTVKLISHLPKMRLESINQEYDMMILWNMKKPTIKRSFSI